MSQGTDERTEHWSEGETIGASEGAQRRFDDELERLERSIEHLAQSISGILSIETPQADVEQLVAKAEIDHSSALTSQVNRLAGYTNRLNRIISRVEL